MKSYLKTKDFFHTQEEFHLLHDVEMDMLITSPKPQDLSKYYPNETYISHSDSRKNLVDKLYQFVKKYSLRKKVNLIDTYSKSGKTLLDIGAGTGDFLLASRKNGWTVFGVEPNSNASHRAAKKDIFLHENLSHVENQTFNVITLWHVLEHLPNLHLQISTFTKLLDKNGTLIIAVPNFKSYDAKRYGQHWAAYDAPRHLWHFSQDAIKNIFSQHHMKVVKIKPMYFDSFYVSLLSEKYKYGKQNIFKAFYIGLLSNFKAIFSKEHSSIIYIIKKV